ncbi:uncharacterized protein [Henckelia pumila]|uniref:uncharacterized protein n=1 Tax=Henckelia pumila TaxID=405737 RepID=UPI003C6DD15A
MEVVKAEILKLLKVRVIYPISDSQWVSPIQVVPQKIGITVVKNEDDELVPTRIQNGWRIAIASEDQEKTTFTCTFGTFAYRRMPLDSAMHRPHSNSAWQGIVLGHVVSSKWIEVDKAKIDIIQSLPYPTCVREVRSFLGHAGFYWRYIQDFAKIASPMCKLLEKDVPFEFDEPCKALFEKLKDSLTSAPIIQPLD